MRNVLKLFHWSLGVEQLTPSGRSGIKKGMDKRYRYPILNFHLRNYSDNKYSLGDVVAECWDIGLDYEENKVIFYEDT